ncbi:MAG: hypothetical protein PUK30_09785 [Dorea formicigenerans]|nr:hypothetical protein [Dorea formicigenerans]MDD7520091.1 hypothetical protein [Dorea formicigenerans]
MMLAKYWKLHQSSEKQWTVLFLCGCGKIDIYALEEDDIVYDAEPQKTNTKNFPKRSRLYQGLIDSNLLPPGSIDFNALNTVKELEKNT